MSCGFVPYSVSKSNVFCVVAASLEPCVVPLFFESWYWKPPVKPERKRRVALICSALYSA